LPPPPPAGTFDLPAVQRRSVTDADEITALLSALSRGDRGALDRLYPLVYGELHQRAHGQLARFRPGDTLSTTALVHEAYLR
jgi:hypothetical protein